MPAGLSKGSNRRLSYPAAVGGDPRPNPNNFNPRLGKKKPATRAGSSIVDSSSVIQVARVSMSPASTG